MERERERENTFRCGQELALYVHTHPVDSGIGCRHTHMYLQLW